MKPYLKVSNGNLTDVLEDIVSKRQDDISDFDNLYSMSIKVMRRGAPLSSTDVSPSDKVGDAYLDSNYFYTVVSFNNSAEWRRIPLQSW